MSEDNGLHRGDLALDAYDFEAARAHYASALGEESTGLRAARKLVALLVDQLGCDEDALALESSLRPEVASDSSIRELLALAAARCSQVERAVGLLRGVETPRTAEVFAILAREALREGDVDLAQRRLASARERDPALPELLPLADALAEALREARRPQEEEVGNAWARGEVAEAERLARAVLDRWPDSAAARRVLREVESAQRGDRIRALLAQADDALRGGRFAALAEFLRHAAGLGEKGLEQRIAEADLRARALHEQGRLEAAGLLLQRPDREVALTEFLELELELRERARALVGCAGDDGSAQPRCGRRGLGCVRSLCGPQRNRPCIHAARRH